VLSILLHNQGAIQARAGNMEAAAASFREALALDPSLWDTRFQLAGTLARARRFGEAAQEYGRVVAERPRDLRARLVLATSLVLAESYSEARVALEAGLEEFPDQPEMTLALAKLLATCPQPEVRDGDRSLALALGAWERSQGLEQAEAVAMAQAEVGAFDEAVRWQRELVARAERVGRPELLALFRDNLARYERGQRARAPWLPGP
jgi:Flp pilus assembly protein TadD